MRINRLMVIGGALLAGNANIGFRFYRGFNFTRYNCDHHDLTTQGLSALLVAGKKRRIKTVLVSN